MVGHSTKWRLHESATQLRIWKNLLCTALFFLHISFPTACVWQESSKSSQISSRGRQVILSCWWSSGNLSHFAYLAQCLHFLFPQKSRGWVLVSRWCVVLTGGSSMSQQLSWAPLRMAALGEQAQGHWHKQGRVYSGMLDVCWVSEEFCLDSFAPADWKVVLPSAWSMERSPGAGLPSPNILEGSFGSPSAVQWRSQITRSPM